MFRSFPDLLPQDELEAATLTCWKEFEEISLYRERERSRVGGREIAVVRCPVFIAIDATWCDATTARILAAFIVSSGPGDYFVIATSMPVDLLGWERNFTTIVFSDRKEFRQLNIARMEK